MYNLSFMVSWSQTNTYRMKEKSQTACFICSITSWLLFSYPALTCPTLVAFSMASTMRRPVPSDSFPTPTSITQAETEKVLLEHYPAGDNTTGGTLQKNAHMQFLVRNMVQGFPARYTSQDASQGWLMYWTLQAFSVLQVGLDPGNKQK